MGVAVGVRLSGGLGPLRVSMPLVSGEASAGGGVVITAIGLLMWWMLLYGVYSPARLLYWELPRAGWRGYQRWQARRSLAAPVPLRATPLTADPAQRRRGPVTRTPVLSEAVANLWPAQSPRGTPCGRLLSSQAR